MQPASRILLSGPQRLGALRRVSNSPYTSSSSSGGRPFLKALAFSTLLAGTYVGGLIESEKIPEIKKIYDDYLPYTKEAKEFLGVTPDGIRNPLANFNIPFAYDIFPLFSKKTEKKDEPAPPSSPGQGSNAPFVPKEGVKVVVTEPKPSTFVPTKLPAPVDEADHLQELLEEGVEEVKELASKTKDEVKELASKTKEAAKEAAKEAGALAKETKEELILAKDKTEEALKQKKDRAMEMLKAASDKLEEEAKEKKEQAKELLSVAKDEASAKKDQAKHFLEEKLEDAQDAVRSIREGIEHKKEQAEDLAHHAKEAAAEKASTLKKEARSELSDMVEVSKKKVQKADKALQGIEDQFTALVKKAESVISATHTDEIKKEIEALRAKMSGLAEEKRQAELKFKQELETLQQHLMNEAQAKLRAAEDKYEKDLAQQYRTQENLYSLQVKEELEKQKEALGALFKQDLDLALRKERAERMAKLEKMAATASALEQIARKQGAAESVNSSVRKILVSLNSFQEAIDNHRPFTRELDSLKRASSQLPLVLLSLESLQDSIAERGVCSPAEIIGRFSGMKRSVEGAAFVGPNGGMWSFAISQVLSAFASSPAGYVEGDDPNAILARAEHHLARGDIESGAREVNQLKGWHKKLAQDWLNQAREYLEVRQALAVVETEVAHQLLHL